MRNLCKGLLVLFALGAICACSGSPPSHSEIPQLRGVYGATESGRFEWIDFVDASHFVLWRTDTCAGGCAESGTFVASEAMLDLTDDQTGKTESLPIEYLQTTAAPTAAAMVPTTEALHVLACDPTALVSCQTQEALVKPTAAAANVGGQNIILCLRREASWPSEPCSAAHQYVPTTGNTTSP